MAKQLRLLPKFEESYGGELYKKRKGRAHGRPLSTQNSMHLVLRSTQAHGTKSFLEPSNARKITNFIKKFAAINHVRILSLANVGNHLHMHIKLGWRRGYKPFIQALTAAIAVSIGGQSRWSKKSSITEGEAHKKTKKFWDLRPFTRIVQSFRALLTLNNYIEINRLEGQGYARREARMLIDSSSSFRGIRPASSG
jgi:REP element-mobilizing transposase RayT